MSVDRPSIGALVPIPTYRGTPATTASDLSGVDLEAQAWSAKVIGADHWTLLLFVSAACEGCRDIWAALSESPEWPGVAGVRALVVTRTPATEDVDELRRLAVPGVGVIMSDDAYGAYRVHGPPFFALVDGRGGRVVTEGVAWGAAHVVEEVVRARAGGHGPEPRRLDPRTPVR